MYGSEESSNSIGLRMNFSKSRLSIKCRFMWKIHDEQMIPKRFCGLGYNGLDNAFHVILIILAYCIISQEICFSIIWI